MRSFETNYLRTARRREKVSSAKSMWRVADEQQTNVLATSSSQSFWKMLTGWKFVTGAAVILLGYGLGYYALYSGKLTVEIVRTPENEESVSLRTGISEEPEPVNTTVASAAGDRVNAVIPIENTTRPNPKRPVTPGTIPSTVATFTLSAGSLRGEGEQSITIGPNTSAIDLRLGPAKDAPKYQTYSVTLKTADGETILSERRVRTPRLRVPASRLERRTYIVLVEGLTAHGTSEPVAEYTFRVRR